MYNKKEIEAGLKKQLAIDFNCTVEDFDKKENIITFPKDNPGRRIYTQQKEFLSSAEITVLPPSVTIERNSFCCV